ncbi:MAG: hypothetical protein JWQ30_806, partial [Sediminibacterium sp.]|nr:hypothetical protein [Sediminibacterium sp.]
QAVEQFVQANPDLAIELEMLQQMQLPAEQMVFDEKASLYKNEASGINLANHEEQFLLYVDNELDADQKEKVETFVLQHPVLQEGFTLLKQTRLEPEQITFADKQSLYREEKKERPVFYMGWQRIAIAAALIGLVVLVWSVLPGNKKVQQDLVVNPPIIAKPGAGKGSSVDKTGETTIVQPGNNIASVNSVNANSKAGTNTNTGNSLAPATDPVIAKTEIPVTPVETQKQDIVSTTSQNSFQTTIATTQQVSGDHPTVENVEITKTVMTPDGSIPNDNIQPAVYKELDTEDEKKSLLLGSLEINKDKLRGFFRKAGSLFRSKSKTEEDKTDTRPTSKSK